MGKDKAFRKIIAAYREQLQKELAFGRFEHSLGVASMSVSLAMAYADESDPDKYIEFLKKAEIAGLLHDCAKYPSEEKMMKKVSAYGLKLSPYEAANHALIHASLGAYVAAKEYEIKDKEILSAIQYHTTGKPAMSMLEKIVYLADYIEPSRSMIPGLNDVRKLAFKNLDDAVRLEMQHVTDYLKSTDSPLDPMTADALKYYDNGDEQQGACIS